MQYIIRSFIKVIKNPTSKALQTTELSLYVAFKYKWNDTKKIKNIDERVILLKKINFSEESQLVL